jgi:hypothetical protein
MPAMAEIDIPAGDDPAATLAAATALRRLADRLEREAVDRAVALGWSWAQVAQALGVTRQAAHKRHADRLRRQGLSTKENR